MNYKQLKIIDQQIRRKAAESAARYIAVKKMQARVKRIIKKEIFVLICIACFIWWLY
tara:strand:+ start:2597 stop:2767 length:171 start_codon:yes stop_codon:yes gene_type:complete